MTQRWAAAEGFPNLSAMVAGDAALAGQQMALDVSCANISLLIDIFGLF
jgi:hypothetical protein